MNLHSTQDVLKILRISKPTLYKLIKQHNLSISKTSCNGHYRYSDEDIYILQNKSKKYLEHNEIKTLSESIINTLGSFLAKDMSEEEVKKILRKNFLYNIDKFKIITLNQTKLN